jgi:hypothetical protein
VSLTKDQIKNIDVPLETSYDTGNEDYANDIQKLEEWSYWSKLRLTDEDIENLLKNLNLKFDNVKIMDKPKIHKMEAIQVDEEARITIQLKTKLHLEEPLMYLKELLRINGFQRYSILNLVKTKDKKQEHIWGMKIQSEDEEEDDD